MDLSILVKMSNTYGSNPAYVLAGGGNTSVKDDTTLYVKGSGTQLATIKAEEFVKMDRARLNEIMKTEYPADDVKRESAYLADVMAAVTDEDKTKRPSVEALLHNLFAYTYVLHVHPTLINGLTCGKGAKALCEELLGKDVLWIDICKPGYTLARICFEKMNAYKEETGKDVQVLLLQNHGIFVAADTVEEIGVLFDSVIEKLEKQVKRTADVSNAVTPEKEQAAEKLSRLLGHRVEVVPAAEADNFVKDLEKNSNKSIEINEKENKIKIENEIIKYEEKDIGVRSFSVPYFVKNQTIINYDGNDEELINKIEDICTAYTDKEIEAIEETMPILKKYSEERKKNLEGVAIIWRDHFLEENVGLLTSMVRMGVKPEDVLAIDKGDSTKHRQEITATFKKLGYQVDVLDNTAVANDILIEDGKRLIREFIDKRKDKKIVILDDGAIVSRILTLHNYENVEAFVELTVTGLKRIGELKENELPYPVLNVAKSKLKRFITYKEIANTIFTRSIELLAGEKLVGRTVIQLGYGDLGEVLADRYSQYGARVIVIEPDVMKCIEAAEKGFTTFRTLEEAVKYDKPFLIVGASGYNSISKEVIEQLEDGTFITSGATADLNIFKEYEKEGYKYKAIPKYGTQYEINGKKITVLGNGRSVNLFDSEAIPNRSNDIFKASQLVVTDKIINGKDDLRNQVELDIVDKWIDESNILEEYYNLYFKRK